MMSKDSDAEDDSAEIEELLAEELLAELGEDGSNSRYDNLHSSNGSHTKTQLYTSIMHTHDSKGPPFFNTHDKEEERTPHAHLHLAQMRTDAPTDTPPISPLKFSHTHNPKMHVFTVDMPPSPPPSPPPCGCSCFLLPSHKRIKEQKKSSPKDQRSSKIKIKAKAGDDDDNYSAVFKETGPQHMDAGGLFDVKNTEREFKRASMKEKQLTQEAQKFLNMVARS